MKRVIGIVLAATLGASTAHAGTTIVVMPTQGNPAQSGTDLLNAVASITDNDANRRYVVKLDPGVYDLGDQSLVMKPFVDIAGSGVESTLVYGNGNLDEQGLFRGVVEGADSAELRDLTIQVLPAEGRQILVGMFNPSVSPRVTNVRFRANDSTNYCSGLFGIGSSSIIKDVDVRVRCAEFAEGMSFDLALGRPLILRTELFAQSTDALGYAAGLALYQGGAPSEIRDSKITAWGGAVAVGLDARTVDQNAITVVTDSTLSGLAGTASYGVRSGPQSLLTIQLRHSRVAGHLGTSSIGIEKQSLAFLLVENSIVIGSSNTVSGAAGPPVHVGASKLHGGPTVGNVVCGGVYDESFTFFTSGCP